MLNLARTALQRLGSSLPASLGGLGFRLPFGAAKAAVAATPAYALRRHARRCRRWLPVVRSSHDPCAAIR